MCRVTSKREQGEKPKEDEGAGEDEWEEKIASESMPENERQRPRVRRHSLKKIEEEGHGVKTRNKEVGGGKLPRTIKTTRLLEVKDCSAASCNLQRSATPKQLPSKVTAVDPTEA